jgi:hypothetical protein
LFQPIDDDRAGSGIDDPAEHRTVEPGSNADSDHAPTDLFGADDGPEIDAFHLMAEADGSGGPDPDYTETFHPNRRSTDGSANVDPRVHEEIWGRDYLDGMTGGDSFDYGMTGADDTDNHASDVYSASRDYGEDEEPLASADFETADPFDPLSALTAGISPDTEPTDPIEPAPSASPSDIGPFEVTEPAIVTEAVASQDAGMFSTSQAPSSLLEALTGSTMPSNESDNEGADPSEPQRRSTVLPAVDDDSVAWSVVDDVPDSDGVTPKERADIDARGSWIPPALRGMAPDAAEAGENLPRRRSR